MHGNLEQKLKCAFNIYDSNGDGVIDKSEMKIVIDSIYELIGEDMKLLKRTRLSEKKVDEIFQRLDKNKDNCITLQEFIDGYLNDKYLMTLLNTTVSFKNLDIDDSLTCDSLESSILTDISDESIQQIEEYEDEYVTGL